MSKAPFLFPLLLFSALCALATWCGVYFTGNAFTWHFVFLLTYFTLVTLALLMWQERSSAQANIFIRRFMGGLVMKLMGSLLVFAILLKVAPPEVDKPLTVAFAGRYVAYLAFSTVRLSRVIRTAGK
ncbi:MAG: hypothetical protein IPG92_10465 [Flavobacteriales bacterium]|nr:hypothetical protein [Flavobacteriales bacterium]